MFNLFNKNIRKSYFNKELHYIVKQLSSAKSFPTNRQTEFSNLTDKELLACFEDTDYFISLTKKQYKDVFQEVVKRISTAHGYPTPVVSVEMYSEKQMLRGKLQNDSLIVNARCNLNNTIEVFLPTKTQIITNCTSEEASNLGLRYLFNIYHESVHARQFNNILNLFYEDKINNMKEFDKCVSIYNIALISNRLLKRDVELNETYIDTINELEANMRSYALFVQNIEHGCFQNVKNASSFINQKIVDDCAFNPQLNEFVENILKSTDKELLEFELGFKSKNNRSIAALYANLDRNPIVVKLEKYNNYLRTAFTGHFTEYILNPNCPPCAKDLLLNCDFISLKAIEDNNRMLKETGFGADASGEVKVHPESDRITLATKEDIINELNKPYKEAKKKDEGAQQ